MLDFAVIAVLVVFVLLFVVTLMVEESLVQIKKRLAALEKPPIYVNTDTKLKKGTR